LIVGAGITGLTIARELIRRGVGGIVILEKESVLGQHASGRNSGVLHAGMYYTPDTMKAKYCVDGNRMMKEFCREKNLTLHETGKVILATGPAEMEALYELKRRADLCGARASIIDNKKLHELEPYAADSEEALHSPDTAVIRPVEVLQALEAELTESGKVTVHYGTTFNRLDGDNQAQTSGGTIKFEKLINAAGAYADRIAHQFGLAKEYKLLPFKGTYKQVASERSFLVRSNIYPVPDLRTPFLGVHFTRSADGEILVGPTAMPAFGRENYGIFSGFDRESVSILLREAVLLFTDPVFRLNAVKEPRKYLKRFVYKGAKRLLPELKPEDITDSTHVGIRPQLIHWASRQLVMDFIVVNESNSLHILNPISPAFTTSLAFARDMADKLLGK
jgi:L-2-hydroxyglutarate oxidase LhgO